MHPVFTQVPPNLSRSIIATVLPAPANRAAMGGPAWPVPIIIASKCLTGETVTAVLIIAPTVRELSVLSDLDDIAVRIANVAANLVVLGNRRRDELRSSTFP